MSLRKHRIKLIMSPVNKDKCHCLNVFGLAVYLIDFNYGEFLKDYNTYIHAASKQASLFYTLTML